MDIKSEVDDPRPRIRRSTRKARETRLSILTAAARLFSEVGYAECSLRGIASAASLKAGSVYYHFNSKDEILDEVLDTGIERLRDNVCAALERIGADAPLEKQLWAAMRAHVSSFLDDRDDANTFLRIYEHLPPIMKRRSRAARQVYARLWFDLLRKGQVSGQIDRVLDLTIFTPFILQGLNRIPEWFSPTRMTVERVCEVVFSTTIKAVLVGPAPTADFPAGIEPIGSGKTDSNTAS